MTPKEVAKRVAMIGECRGDYEAAHGMEDQLREDVLQAIAGGAPNAADLAREALKSTDMDFPRYCA